MLEFLVVFHSDGKRKSATAILKSGSLEEAKHKTSAMAASDGRPVELWRNQELIATFSAGRAADLEWLE